MLCRNDDYMGRNRVHHFLLFMEYLMVTRLEGYCGQMLADWPTGIEYLRRGSYTM